MEREWTKRRSWSSFFLFHSTKSAAVEFFCFVFFPTLSPLLFLSPFKTKQEMTDLNTYLLRSRVVFVGSRITDEVRRKWKEWPRFAVLFFVLFFSRPRKLNLDLIKTSLSFNFIRRPSASSPRCSRWRSSTTRRRSRCTSTLRAEAPIPRSESSTR